jgi:thiamine pyrophosphate-dependent acetolactate synthase large subunit-like protein
MLVAEAVGRALVALGADHVFGVVGSGNFHAANAMVAAGARYVAARHEAGATTMADGYARVSGRLGVVTVHQGPGLTNAMTGITEAAKSRTPLVVLAADTGAAAVRSNFRIDQGGLATAVGAVPERVHSAQSALADTVRAVRRSIVERRTVLLNLPLDVQAEAVPDATVDGLAALRPVVALPPRRRCRHWRRCSPAPAGRCSWPGAERGPPGRRSRRWPSGAARCSRPRPSRKDCSRATRGRWTCRAGSPHRWRPS